MKGYIEVNNPDTCLGCRFCRELHEGIEACCEMSDEPNDKTLCRMIDVHYCMERPVWCPIKNYKEIITADVKYVDKLNSIDMINVTDYEGVCTAMEKLDDLS